MTTSDDILVLDYDPGKHVKADVPDGEGGTRRRHYVDALSLSDDLRRRVLASARSDRRIAVTAVNRSRRVRGMVVPGLRIGYAFWGFLGDHKENERGERLSTPDGNATYSWSIVHEAARRGHRVLPMMPDRDLPAVTAWGTSNFRAFAPSQRWDAYAHLREGGVYEDSYTDFPELDLLLLEWRWPIPGRNTKRDSGSSGFQPDLLRQEELLRHYSKKATRIVVWDLDHKLTEDDERRWGFSVVETSVVPRRQHVSRVSIEPPCVVEVLRQIPTEPASEGNLLAYIGSRYERDDVIDEWIRPIANRDGVRGRIHFHGKWEQPDCSIRWPGVTFHDRVTVSDFQKIYGNACAVPLLAKRSYMGSGFVTPRVWEALMFGAVPVGLRGHLGVSRYTEHVAEDADGLRALAVDRSTLSLSERHEERMRAIDKISFMDVRHLIDRLESMV